jgi:predicted metal-dependent hydrolase
MSMVTCCYCDNVKEKNVMKRIINDGIKYKCNTPECALIYKEKQNIKQQQIYIQKKQEEEKKQMEQNIKWGEYISDKHKDFILAEIQTRDMSSKYIDPYTKKGFRQCRRTDTWSEYQIKLTHKDRVNIKEARKKIGEVTGHLFSSDDDEDEDDDEVNAHS